MYTEPHVDFPRSIPMVAIVGRPNVGKSTLFNRMMGVTTAIVSPESGTTRDRIIGRLELDQYAFLIADTGGLEYGEISEMADKVRYQVEEAIREADLILMLVDARDGLTPADEEVAHRIRRQTKPVVLVANKADNDQRAMMAVADFQRLGLGEPISVSAHHNLGIDDLEDRIKALLPFSTVLEEPEGTRLAIVGRTNVGKSMLLNAILGQERVLVSEISGTTRDAIDSEFTYADEPLVVIDTAGIRRRGRVGRGIEYYSVLRAFRAIDRADLACLVLDAQELVTSQDTHVAGYLHENHKGVVVVVNKWDLAAEKGLEKDQVVAEIIRRLRFISYAPICFISALRSSGIRELLDTLLKVHREELRTIPSSGVHRAVKSAVSKHPPAWSKGRGLHIYGAYQRSVNPPTFVVEVNNPEGVHFSYANYLENQLRQAFDFIVTPIRIEFRRRSRRKG